MSYISTLSRAFNLYTKNFRCELKLSENFKIILEIKYAEFVYIRHVLTEC